MLTRQHYKAVAKAIKDYTYLDRMASDTAIKKPVFVLRLVELFTADNPRFNAGKFIEACCIQNDHKLS